MICRSQSFYLTGNFKYGCNNKLESANYLLIGALSGLLAKMSGVAKVVEKYRALNAFIGGGRVERVELTIRQSLLSK